MNDRFFIDTNILVYSSLQDELTKHDRAASFIASLKGNNIFISTQVLSELYVALLKHGVADAHIVKILSQITEVFNVSAITLDTVVSAWKLKKDTIFLIGTVSLSHRLLRLAVQFYIPRTCNTVR